MSWLAVGVLAVLQQLLPHSLEAAAAALYSRSQEPHCGDDPCSTEQEELPADSQLADRHPDISRLFSRALINDFCSFLRRRCSASSPQLGLVYGKKRMCALFCLHNGMQKWQRGTATYSLEQRTNFLPVGTRVFLVLGLNRTE